MVDDLSFDVFFHLRVHNQLGVYYENAGKVDFRRLDLLYEDAVVSLKGLDSFLQYRLYGVEGLIEEFHDRDPLNRKAELGGFAVSFVVSAV